MNRVKDLTSGSLTQEVIDSANRAFVFMAPRKTPLAKSIQLKKLEGFKKVVNSLKSLRSSLKYCDDLQLQSIESIKLLSTQSGILINSLDTFISPVQASESLKSSSLIIQNILSVFNSDLTRSSFQSLLENLSNFDLIQEEINSGQINSDYKLQVVKAEQAMINELTRKMQKSLLDLEDTKELSLFRYGLDLIYRKKPGDYQGLLNNLMLYRKKRALVELMKVKKLGFVRYLQTLVRVTVNEQELLQAIIGDDGEMMVQEVFKGFFHELSTWCKPEFRSFNFFELFLCLDATEKVKNIPFVDAINKYCEDQIEINIKQTLTCISSYVIVNDTKAPLFFYIKVAELLYTQNSIKEPRVLENFSQVFTEILDKALGYFFDLSTIRSCVLALNTYELIFHTFHKFYAFSLSESIQELKNQIILLEVQRLFELIQGFSQDFSYNFLNFYYKILHSSVISTEIHQILSQPSQNFIKQGISNNLLHKISQKAIINHSNMLLNPSILNIILSYN